MARIENAPTNTVAVAVSTQTDEDEPQQAAGHTSASTGSLGLRTYLKRVMKHRYDETTDRIVEEALAKYRQNRRAEKEMERAAKHEESVPLQKPFDIDANVVKKEHIKEQMDDCGARNPKPSCSPGPTESLGLLNYVKMYKCRHPQVNDCAAYKRASRMYNNLTLRTKQKYRAMGSDMQCSPSQKLTIKKSTGPRSPKPKPKQTKAKPATAPKSRTSRKAK